MKKFTGWLSLFILIFPLVALGGEGDSITPMQPYRKNVIKFNPTPMILWSSKNLTFSYERIINPRQSASLINIAAEYRFYLTRLNRRPVPSGVYIAPYASFYGYKFKNDVNVLNTSIDSAGQVRGQFYIFNLGVELGYQFVLWKRVTLDFVLMGPSLSYYGGELDITGNINLEKIKETNEDLYNKLLEKYPMIGDYVVNKSFKQDGKLDLFSFGFRYLVQIGFHF
jgi:hypothetical protein